ncbi:MAG: hypothetical protein K6F77_06235 [Lachnospiraceae bacterium]|nr:hypothetical protein [Lachnospiraceae bacterium]
MHNTNNIIKLSIGVIVLIALAIGSFVVIKTLYINSSFNSSKSASTPGISSAEEVTPTPNPNAELYDAFPGIVFWGDSQTVGSGGDGVNFPDVVRKLINTQIVSKYNPELNYDHVVNQGICGEDSLTLAGRSGGMPFVLANDVTIPSDTSKVQIEFRSTNGEYVCPMHDEPVSIQGITGILSSENASRRDKQNNVYYFNRIKEGEETVLKAGDEIVYPESTAYRRYVQVLFIGQNGTFKDTDELIEQLTTMVNRQTNKNKRYIIIGTHTGTTEKNQETEEKMEAAFGKHYINLREYMSTEALEDAGIEPCAKDSRGVSNGRAPISFKSGFVHFNSVGYALLGNLVYERCEKLGYLNKLKKKCGITEKDTSSPEVALEGIDVESVVAKSRELFGTE